MPKTKGSANAIGVIYGSGDVFGETAFLGSIVLGLSCGACSFKEVYPDSWKDSWKDPVFISMPGFSIDSWKDPVFKGMPGFSGKFFPGATQCSKVCPASLVKVLALNSVAF